MVEPDINGVRLRRKFDEFDLATCRINTQDLWDATELVNSIAASINDGTLEDVPLVEELVRRAGRDAKQFELIGGDPIDEILVELDDIAVQAAQGTVLREEVQRRQPGRIPTDPEILQSLQGRLERLEQKMRVRAAVETVECLLSEHEGREG